MQTPRQHTGHVFLFRGGQHDFVEPRLLGLGARRGIDFDTQ